ncbi:MAG: hypothetical protein AAB433_23010 [Nitrospirota bacterium]
MSKVPACQRFLFLTACVGMMIDSAISKYESIADQVVQGISKKNDLPILVPTQEDIPKPARMNSDKYLKDAMKTDEAIAPWEAGGAASGRTDLF